MKADVRELLRLEQDVEALECALAILSVVPPAAQGSDQQAPCPSSLLGQRWRVRASEHLSRRFDRELRNGAQVIDSEQVAMSIIKSTAGELALAAEALEYAAQALKAKSEGMKANRVHQAALRARSAAEDLVGADGLGS